MSRATAEPDPMTYIRCPRCGGTGAVPDPRDENGLRFVACVCPTGWLPTGVTESQLEKLADRERAIQGDPGLPEPKQLQILLRLRSRVNQALDRLRAEVGGEG